MNVNAWPYPTDPDVCHQAISTDSRKLADCYERMLMDDMGNEWTRAAFLTVAAAAIARCRLLEEMLADQGRTQLAPTRPAHSPRRGASARLVASDRDQSDGSNVIPLRRRQVLPRGAA